MEIQEIYCSQTGDKCNYIKHSSGLDIYICEMNGFSTTEALFGTKYGSINTMFKTKDDADYTTVPEGIAHFLEHKLFENEYCDAFALYAKTGANANAYTSFDRTCYLYSCSDNYLESLKILLGFVQNPYFTQETVDKEQGIIGQEIKMTNDNPGWRVLFNMLRCMYHNHPVKIDIAGTVESIAQIDAELLYKCYNTFYNLHNMVLVLAGNVNTNDVLAVADELLKPCENTELETVFPDEPYEIVESEFSEHLPVGSPIFNIGIKCSPLSGYERLKANMECYIAGSILSDPSSQLYKKLIEQELINSTFGYEVFEGDGFFTLIFSGESSDPKKVRDMLIEEIERVKKEGLDRKLYDSIKKSGYGEMIMDSNNVEAVASNLISAYMSDTQPYDQIKILSEMTYEDVQNALVERFDTKNLVLSVIE
ncbi:MAG: insulinase family protein [Oscillospiraceae bacterium]|nr:insulinase family protein [Oscillospiraceae bacterium]